MDSQDTYLCVAICTPNCLPGSSQQSNRRNCCWCSRKHYPCCFSSARIPHNYRILRTQTARMTTANRRKIHRTRFFLWKQKAHLPSPTSKPSRLAIHVNLWELFRTTFISFQLLAKNGKYENAANWCVFPILLFALFGIRWQLHYCTFVRVTAQHVRWVRSVSAPLSIWWSNAFKYITKMFKWVDCSRFSEIIKIVGCWIIYSFIYLHRQPSSVWIVPNSHLAILVPTSMKIAITEIR